MDIKGPKSNQQVTQLNYITQNWLDKLHSLKTINLDTDVVKPTKTVHYKLTINEENGSFSITSYVVKLKKDGSVSRVSPTFINLDDIMSVMRTHGNNVPDWQLIQELLALGGNINTYRIRTPMTIGILKAVVATGRCFLESNIYDEYQSMAPLQWGPEQHGRMEWKFVNDCNQQLKFFCDDTPETEDQFILLDTVPYTYYNKKNKSIGPISFGVPDVLARTLHDAPSISITEASVVQELLANTLPSSYSIPQINKPVPKEISGFSPKPRLTLSAGPNPAKMWYHYNRPSIPIAQVSFLYDGIPIMASNPPKEVIQIGYKDSLFQITRDLDAEKKAHRYLSVKIKKQKGWKPSVSDNLRPSPEYYYTKDEGNLSIAADDAYESIVPYLIEQGWEIELHSSYPYRPIQGLGEWYANIESTGIDWFEVNIGVMIQGQQFNVLPLLLKALKKMGDEGIDKFLEKGAKDLKIATDKGILTVPKDILQRILGTLIELFDYAPLTEEGKLRLSKWQLAMMHELTKAEAATRLRWMGSTEIQSLASRLANRQAEPITVPQSLNCSLRPYQQEGINWLQFLRTNEMAGILADDMGLGKTVQTLAHILIEKTEGRLKNPALVVAPTSLMVNWRLEAEKFTPTLKVLILQGYQRKQSFESIQDHDIILTTYPLLPRDKDMLLEHEYHLLILDEAHIAKNANTIAYKVLQQIKATHRVCLTGTPMENHLGELWALFNFLMPGFLGDSKRFTAVFRNPIEKHGDQSRREWLSKRLSPFMMRRTKEEVATELPPKTIIVQKIELEEQQKQLYEAIRLAMNSKVQAEIESKGLKRSHIIILDALLKMRQVCCDPRLLKLKTAQATKESAKLNVLMQLLPEMIEAKRQILVFSQFTSMLSLIEQELKIKKIPYVLLTGETKDRATPVEMFQSGKVPLFLISLKAGGVGLNLTAADTVIHYDPWWNPAAENQATDRSHRIGQTKPVFVYKLITTGTIEEKIINLQERKASLLTGLFDETKADKVKLTETDIANLFAPLESA